MVTLQLHRITFKFIISLSLLLCSEQFHRSVKIYGVLFSIADGFPLRSATLSCHQEMLSSFLVFLTFGLHFLEISSDATWTRAKVLADEIGSWHLDVSIHCGVCVSISISNTYGKASSLQDYLGHTCNR